VATELHIQEEINAQKCYLVHQGETDKTGAFVLDPEYPIFRLPCPEMSPDAPVYEEPLIEPPMRRWKLHPPNQAWFTCHNIRTVWKTAQAACGVLSPHFEEIDTIFIKK
jgi:hypothetical protein